MANETKSSSFDNSTLTFALTDRILSANLPKWVVQGVCNVMDIAGSGSDTARINSWSDLGVAGAGTEGTEYTTNEEVTMATAVDLTVAEAAAIQRAVVTNFSLEVRQAGVADVHEMMQNGDLATKMRVLGPVTDPMSAACIEKREDDLANLLSGFANTAGTSGSDLTLADVFAAEYTLKTLEPLHEDWVLVLTPNQVKELKSDIGVNGGGLGGSVWVNQGDLSFFNHRPDMPRNGFRGSFTGFPIYEYSHSLRTLANADADVAGALMCRGVGDPRQGGQLGAIAIAQSGFLKFHIQYEAGYRGVVVVITSDHKALEARDTHGVSILTDAP